MHLLCIVSFFLLQYLYNTQWLSETKSQMSYLFTQSLPINQSPIRIIVFQSVAGVQRPSGVGISASSTGGEQMWPCWSNPGWWMQAKGFQHGFSTKCHPYTVASHRSPPTWHWSSLTPTTCCCSRRQRKTQRRVRTSTPSSCRWPAAWRPRNPYSTETWSERMGEWDSHRRRRQRLTVRVEGEEDGESLWERNERSSLHKQEA